MKILSHSSDEHLPVAIWIVDAMSSTLIIEKPPMILIEWRTNPFIMILKPC
jgi:hypothetical protein